ncbi:FAD-dependent oxidoreductase [Lentzea sp. NPDC059081]|uniref:FAD-dependent oxidoreductase n=1 Tax=Lentzea sp. NPDC059081 TaxID=3346719 RepID=UPI00369C8F9B
MSTPRVLISGAGIAGNALGVALGRRGITATVVERAPGPRTGGHTVDLRGHSRHVLRDWNLLDEVTALRVAEERMVAVGHDGNELWRMPAQDGGIVADVEIGREDLNAVLEKASAADIRYGEHLVATGATATGVRTETSRGHQLDADVLVIAEGTRSSLRARLFPEAKSCYLGGYLALVALSYPEEFGGDMRVFSAGGGVMVAIRPGRVQGMALVAVRAPQRPELTNDTAAQRRFVAEHITRAGVADKWYVPSVLDRIAHDPGFHCEELTKVVAPSWSTGRTVLLGDTAWSGSALTGLGTAMAIMGAEALADAIATQPGDLDSALHAYETKMRRFTRWSHADASPSMLKRWAPSTERQARMNALVMRTVTRTPLRRMLTRAVRPPAWTA